MIQFNLLPDVKMAYVKAQRQKQIVLSASTIAIIASVAIFVLLFAFVNLIQHKSVNDLTKDIKSQSTDLMGTDDLNKILTVQNQLAALDTLHSGKVATPRLFQYIQQTTPSQSTISQLDADFSANTLTITGEAPALVDVNIFADALKFTKYKTADDTTEKPAFSNVVLSNYSRTVDKTTYTLTLSFDPVIFQEDQTISLDVPNMVTTRSSVERPTDLFTQTKPTTAQ